MPIIIPSKHIYDIDNPKVINNATNGVNYNYNYPKKQIGYVSNQYYFNFYEYDYENNSFVEKFTDKENTSDIEFTHQSLAGNIYLSANITFNINQITNIKIENTEEIKRIITHKLKFNQVKMDSKELQEYDEVANLQIDNFEYDEVENTVKFKLTILVAEYRGSLYGSYIYLMSADIGIVGEYITFDRLKHTVGGTRNVTDLPTNELVQKLDPYLSNKILLEWSKGKETATLKCDISDYYDENGNKVINVSDNKNYFPEIPSSTNNGLRLTYESGVYHIEGIPIDTNVTTQFFVSYDNAYIPLEDGYYSLGYEIVGEATKNILVAIDGKKYGVSGVPFFIKGKGGNDLNKTEWSRLAFFILVELGIEHYINCDIKIVLNKDYMTFVENQKVIPYLYSENGQDVPMSLYLDGTPKVFEVVGTEKTYDGAVFQKISLLEVYKST